MLHFSFTFIIFSQQQTGLTISEPLKSGLKQFLQFLHKEFLLEQINKKNSASKRNHIVVDGNFPATSKECRIVSLLWTFLGVVYILNKNKL